MRIVLVTNLSEPETIDIDQNTDFATFEMIAGSYVNIDPTNLLIKKDGKIIKGTSTALLSSLGIRDGDVLLTSKKPPQSASSSTNFLDFSGIDPSILSRGQPQQTQPKINPTTEQVRKQLLSLSPDVLSQYKAFNPNLFDNLHNPVRFQQIYEEQQRLMAQNNSEVAQLSSGNLLDPSVQSRIEELIKKNNIDSQMEHAMEHNPESFAQTTMLYVNCHINDHSAKAFVDSGAQMTFISADFARQCHVDHLIDTRWMGVARGVGTQNIVGRVHCVQLQIAGAFLQMSVSVLADQQMDILIGLDMLKRYQCVINLRRNVLEIGSANVETPFLPESELPSHAKLNNSENENKNHSS